MLLACYMYLGMGIEADARLTDLTVLGEGTLEYCTMQPRKGPGSSICICFYTIPGGFVSRAFIAHSHAQDEANSRTTGKLDPPPFTKRVFVALILGIQQFEEQDDSTSNLTT